MASAPTDFLSQLPQNEIFQLRTVIASDFDHLSKDQRDFLYRIGQPAGYKTDLELFLDLKLHPEKIGLPPLSDDEFTKTTNLQKAVAANLAKYLEDKELLNAQIDKNFQTRTQKDRDLIKRLVEIAALRRQTEILIANANIKTRQTIADLNTNVFYVSQGEKYTLLSKIDQTSHEVVQAAIKQSGLTLTRSEEALATTLITIATIAGVVDPSQPEFLNEIVQAAIPKLNTPISKTFQEIEANLLFTPIPRYDDPNQTQLFPNISIILPTITLPEAEIVTPIVITPSAQEQDRLETTKETADKYATAILLNPATDTIVAELIGKITQEERQQFIAAIIADNLVDRSHPTQQASAAATVVDKLGSTRLDPVAIEVISMGLTMRAVQEKIAANPNSSVANFVSAHPNVLPRLAASYGLLENPKNILGLEVSPRLQRQAAQAGTLPPQILPPPPPGPLSSIGRQFQLLTNRVSGFLPGSAGRIFNIVIHPIQSLQSYLGNFIGRRVVGQFKDWLAQKFVSRIANETLKKGAELILKQGLKQGVKLLAEQGLKRGIQAIAVALGAPTGGVSLLIAAALEVAFYVGGKVVAAVGGVVNGIFRAFTGEDFDLRAAVAAPLLFFGGIGAFLGSATAIAASSAAIIIMGSTFVGFILYISVIGIAPIIAGIAHLESGQGAPYSVVSGGVIPEGCPSGWPVGSGYITAGPRTASLHHHNTEAIDIGVGLGTPIVSTHNGLAISHQGSNGPYGNFVDVNGTCNGIAFTTRYGHMVSTAFEGERPLKQGDIIGYVDSTGNSTGNHVHYEIRGGNLGDINQFLPKHVPIGCDSVAECGNVSLP